MNAKLQLFVAVMIFLSFSACKKEYKPEFNTVLEQGFSGINKKVAKYTAYVVFSNDSDKSFKVENMVADLLVNGKDACTIYFNEKMELKPNSEIKIPARQSFDTKGVFEEGADGYTGTVKSVLKGSLTLIDGEGGTIEVPFSYSESVKITIKKEVRQEASDEKKDTRKEKREARKADK